MRARARVRARARACRARALVARSTHSGIPRFLPFARSTHSCHRQPHSSIQLAQPTTEYKYPKRSATALNNKQLACQHHVKAISNSHTTTNLFRENYIMLLMLQLLLLQLLLLQLLLLIAQGSGAGSAWRAGDGRGDRRGAGRVRWVCTGGV